MKLKVLTLDSLQSCLQDQNFISLDAANQILEQFKAQYKIKSDSVITSLALTIYLDGAMTKENRSVVNRIKATIKDVQYRATIDTK